MSDRLIDTREVASRLGIRPGTIANQRCQGIFPIPSIKVGPLVRFRESDVAGFIARGGMPTAAPGENGGADHGRREAAGS